jgi:hypothetical protein
MYCGENGSVTTNTSSTIPLNQWTHFTGSAASSPPYFFKERPPVFVEDGKKL